MIVKKALRPKKNSGGGGGTVIINNGIDESLLLLKADKTEVYTKEEVDNLVAEVVDIDSVTASESNVSGGNNVVTVTLSDGTSTSFNVKNGQDGADGEDGVSLGQVALVQDTGNNTDKVMSQKAVTDEIELSTYKDSRYNYVGGCLTYLNLNDYPNLDIRNCKGFSIMIDGSNKSRSGYMNNHFFVIGNGNAPSASQPIFSFLFRYGQFNCGLLQNSSNTAIWNGMGVQHTIVTRWSHLAITFDLETGESKLYVNGGLYSTKQAPSWDEDECRMQFANLNYLSLNAPANNVNREYSCSGYCVFGHILTDEEVAELYGNGCEEVKGELLPREYESNRIIPQTYNNNWNINIAGGTKSSSSSGMTVTRTAAQISFGFTGLSGLINRCIYDWEFEVLSGTATTSSSGMTYNSTTYQCISIIDEDGNDVSYNGTLVAGKTYKVTATPDNLLRNIWNASQGQLCYVFTDASNDFSFRIKRTLKVTERGAAIKCTKQNFFGDHWRLNNGNSIPVSDVTRYASMAGCTPFYNTWKPSTLIYNSNQAPQFNGQLAVSPSNGKIYAGYLTTANNAGTWKQINNS